MLDGKIALVTGSAGGIGRGTAIEMARQGASVIVSDVNDEGGEETLETIRGEGGRPSSSIRISRRSMSAVR